MLDATEGGVTGSSDLPDVDVGDRTLVFGKHAKHSSQLSYLCSPQLVTVLMTQFPPLGPFYHSTFLKDKGWTFQEQSRFLFTIPLTISNTSRCRRVKLPPGPCPISSYNSQEDDKRLHKMADDKNSHKMAQGCFPRDMGLVRIFKRSCSSLPVGGRELTIILVRRSNPKSAVAEQTARDRSLSHGETHSNRHPTQQKQRAQHGLRR